MSEKPDKKDLKSRLEEEAADIFEKQNQLAVLEEKLSRNKEFQAYLQFQKKVKEQDDLFRKLVLAEMSKFNIKKISGDWGSINYIQRRDYKVVDEEKVPDNYKTEKVIVEVDTKAIKSDHELTEILPPGVEIKLTEYIKINPKKEEK